MTIDERPTLDPEVETDVRSVTERVAQRLVTAIEQDTDADHSAAEVTADERRQLLMIGGWVSDEITWLNEQRMRAGSAPLDLDVEHRLRARVVAELTGAGPLEPYLG